MFTSHSELSYMYTVSFWHMRTWDGYWKDGSTVWNKPEVSHIVEQTLNCSQTWSFSHNLEQTWSASHCGTNFKLLPNLKFLSQFGTNLKCLTLWNKPKVSHVVEQTWSLSHCWTNLKFLTWNIPKFLEFVKQAGVMSIQGGRPWSLVRIDSYLLFNAYSNV